MKPGPIPKENDAIYRAIAKKVNPALGFSNKLSLKATDNINNALNIPNKLIYKNGFLPLFSIMNMGGKIKHNFMNPMRTEPARIWGEGGRRRRRGKEGR